MLRLAAPISCAIALAGASASGCGRSQGISDQELPGLVVEARKADPPIDVARAAKDPGELGRALARPYRQTLAAIGPHSAAINTSTTVEEAGKVVSELSDHAQIENGEAGSFHAVYTNSADYGRETTVVGDKLYLRPRYQRWHLRAPEQPDEPAQLRDQYAEAAFATWDLLAPGAQLTDRGATQLAGRAARKIDVSLAAEPSPPPHEPLTQRAWREHRSIDAVAGEVVLDDKTGAPLAVKLTGSVGFSRDGRRFTMKVSVDSSVSGLGQPAEIAAPSDGDVVATPERQREVDDRDFLLKGIAPPLRKSETATTKPKPTGPNEPARGSGAKP